MNSLSFVRKIEYHTLLDKNAPVSYYELYESEKHRFALITFYNYAKFTILSFKVKFTYFTKNNDFISTSVYELKPKDFRSHHNFEMSDPLVMPKNADGFNYEIFDVVFQDKKELNKEKLRIKVDKLDTKKVVKPIKHNPYKKWMWLGIFAAGISVLSVVFQTVARLNFDAGVNYNNNDTINENGLVYQYNGDGYIVLEYTGSNSDVYIPSTINGYPVTAITSDSFRANGSIIKTLTIENPSINIASYTFQSCWNLYNVNVTVQSIQEGAFVDCTNLNYAELNVHSIGINAFGNCQALSSLIISECKYIESHAFYDCMNLTYCVVNPECQIADYAFNDNVEIIRK